MYVCCFVFVINAYAVVYLRLGGCVHKCISVRPYVSVFIYACVYVGLCVYVKMCVKVCVRKCQCVAMNDRIHDKLIADDSQKYFIQSAKLI